MAVHYKLQSFEGPLDLLLHLIDKAEVDIYNIPISKITDQYMEYVNTMQQLELDVTSEFLVMAATLLSIKSNMLLPKPPVIEIDPELTEQGIDPRAELVQKLIEYRKYKGIAEHLREQELARSLIYSREPEDLTPFMPKTPQNPLLGLQVSDLVLAFQKALRKSVRSNTVARIRRDEISVKDRMAQIVDLVRTRGGRVLFSKLIPEDVMKEEIVVTFLAILELMKVKIISCYQHQLFEDIVIQYRERENDDGLPAVEIHY